jgi:multiple sugar transport system ATP-binding protein
MAEVVLDAINKIYSNGFHAIKDLTLTVADGEFLILVGPSGCGKSTAMRMIAGLEDVSAGDLLIGGRSVVDVAPKDRDIAMVFQNYALYPHMNVYDNIAFSMKLARVNRTEIRERVHRVAKILELDKLLKSRPAQLSGGQRQRVAMGRAMVRNPAVFLMDEPLSNLDAKLRVQMRGEIARIQKELGATTIYVTHDQIEAMTMGDRVAVLKDGILQQVGSPKDLYDKPTNVFVAGFIGSPSMNLFSGQLSDGVLYFGQNSITLPKSLMERRKGLVAFDKMSLIFGIRPEDISDSTLDHNSSWPCIPATVSVIEELGAEHIVYLNIDAHPVDSGDPDIIEEIGNAANTVARFDPRSKVRIDERIDVMINPEKIHFFDPATSLAI